MAGQWGNGQGMPPQGAGYGIGAPGAPGGGFHQYGSAPRDMNQMSQDYFSQLGHIR